MAAAAAKARVVRRSTIPRLLLSTELVRRGRSKLSWVSHGNNDLPHQAVSRARRPGRPPSSSIGQSEVTDRGDS
jgi:hypothetical protein